MIYGVQGQSDGYFMYPARGGLVWGQMRGCYLKSGGLPPPRGLYNILIRKFITREFLQPKQSRVRAHRQH